MITFENGALTTDATLSVTDSQAIFQFADYCVGAERSRIIKLLEELFSGVPNYQARRCLINAIALIKGEQNG